MEPILAETTGDNSWRKATKHRQREDTDAEERDGHGANLSAHTLNSSAEKQPVETLSPQPLTEMICSR